MGVPSSTGDPIAVRPAAWTSTLAHSTSARSPAGRSLPDAEGLTLRPLTRLCPEWHLSPAPGMFRVEELGARVALRWLPG